MLRESEERAPLLSKEEKLKQLKQEETQDQRTEIEAIFAEILAEKSSLTRLYKDCYPGEVEAKQKPLLAYKDALLKELDYLPVSYDHPLRAARALKAACDNINQGDSLRHIQQFQEEASNSKFNPKLKALGLFVGITLACVAFACLFGFLITLQGGGIPVIPMIVMLGIFGGGVVGGSAGAFLAHLKYKDYEPVTSARSQGKAMSSDLKLLQKLWAQRNEKAADDTQAANDFSVQNPADVDLGQNGSSQAQVKKGFVLGCSIL